MATVAEIMRDVLIENGATNVGYGDCGFLDDCARRATHTNLHSLHPLTRHKRILSALDHSPLFRKGYFRIWVGNREGLARYFTLL